MIPINIYKLYLRFVFAAYYLALLSLSISIVQSDNSDVEITANKIEFLNNENKIKATGNIVVKTQEFLATSNSLVYDKNNEIIKTYGNIIIEDSIKNYYFFDEFTSDKAFSYAGGTNTRIRLNDGSRIVGKSFSRTNSNINQINDAKYTPCIQENYALKNCPGWKLSAKKVIHDVEKKNIYYEGATLSILNIPILYSPFFSHPDPSVKKRSGLLMPNISSDNNLGTSFSIPYFFNITCALDSFFDCFNI